RGRSVLVATEQQRDRVTAQHFFARRTSRSARSASPSSFIHNVHGSVSGALQFSARGSQVPESESVRSARLPCGAWVASRSTWLRRGGNGPCRSLPRSNS